MGIVKIKLGGIYKITHKSGYYYIGKSVDIFGRWQSHYTQLYVSTHHSPEFQKLFENSDISDWSFEILYTLSRTDIKSRTGLKGKELDKVYNRVLLDCEKHIMGKYSINYALNKMKSNFS